MAAKTTDQPSLTVVFTGVIGAGKSEAGNFFAGKQVFFAQRSFGSVTTKSAAETCIVAEQVVKIIDTPGFLDAMLPDKVLFNVTELSHAFVLARDGVHAVGVLIDGSKRCDQYTANALKEILNFPDILPYVFVIFTRARLLSKRESKQKIELERMLGEATCPPQLKKFLHAINNRYILLESKDYNKKSNYRENKSKELLLQIEEIQKSCQNKLLRTNMQLLAKEVYDKICRDPATQEHLAVVKLEDVFKRAGEESKQYAKDGQMGEFWKNASKGAVKIIGMTVGGAIGTFVGMPAGGACTGYIVGDLLGDFVCTIQ